MAVFYRIPEKAGYFDPFKNPTSNMDENSESVAQADEKKYSARHSDPNQTSPLNQVEAAHR